MTPPASHPRSTHSHAANRPAMTRRERLETVLRGGEADRVPFTIYKWLIPDTPTALTLQRDGLTPIDAGALFVDRPRGYTLETRDSTEDGKRWTRKRLVTPVGQLTEATTYDVNFGSPWIVKHWIETPNDMAVMRYVVEHTDFEPAPEDFLRRDRAIGDAGIVLGLVSPIPIMRMWVEMMGTETWAELSMSEVDGFDELHEAVFAAYRRQIDLAADGPAEFIWLPDNVTASVVSPSFYKKYGIPAYDYACSALRRAGKRSFSHYDGACLALRDLIAGTGIDILEALTPPPMGDTTVAQARAAWPDKVLSLNIPGCLFREPDHAIEAAVETYLREAGHPARFIIGCTEEFEFPHFDRAFAAIARAMKRQV